MTKVIMKESINWDDPILVFNKMKAWAKKNCDSFVGMQIEDVSDLVYYDFVATFEFGNVDDANIFIFIWGDEENDAKFSTSFQR